MLAEEHEIADGTRTRTVIEDVYTREIQEAKEAEAKRKALEIEIEQETFPLIISPDFVGTDVANEITDMLQEKDFEIVVDEEKVLTDEILSVLLMDEQEDEDFGDRLNLFSSGPSRCLIIIKGSQGIFEEITPFFALHKVNETKNEEDSLLDAQELNADEEEVKPFESIRDKYGNGDRKAVVKFWESKELADKARQILFPNFTPAKVITRRKEEEKPEKSRGSVEEKDGAAQSSHLEESEELKSQLILIVIFPPAAEAFQMEIMATLSEANFDIKLAREFNFTEETARKFCDVIKVDFSSPDLVKNMTSGATFVLMASKHDAFEAMKEMIGPESFSQARKNEPHSLRARYSALPGTEKTGDLPWIYASCSAQETLAWLPHFFPTEETLAGLKTDTMLPKTVEAIKHAGFEIVAQKEQEIVEGDVHFLYQEHADQAFMQDLVDNLTQCIITFLVLRAPAAITSWRVLMGCSDAEAGFAEPSTDSQSSSSVLRAIYGKNIMENAVFASTTEESAKKCIEYIFGANWNAEAESFFQSTADTPHDIVYASNVHVKSAQIMARRVGVRRVAEIAKRELAPGRRLGEVDSLLTLVAFPPQGDGFSTSKIDSPSALPDRAVYVPKQPTATSADSIIVVGSEQSHDDEKYVLRINNRTGSSLFLSKTNIFERRTQPRVRVNAYHDREWMGICSRNAAGTA
ncbi:unnamed protein product [Dibothriocephalus latus]|uniref:Nucleoside diphosphate kinase-like domain-containing protein n=1 Tax=Dibothriocephalus latus TaxID=60516 RepID=A0A3P7KWL1_DIBLA|nr:unnamed protein product [Dibothriocephalus latus]